MKGLFITFEGGEGSGKSTVIKKLVEHYHNKPLCVTREPGGVKIAEEIRNIILDCDNIGMDPRCEAILYAASRIEHLDKRVIPALNEGQMVLCDRYLDSSLVYQGYARGLGMDKVLQINMFALDYMPDITFFFDCKPEIAFSRIRTNHREENRLDKEEMSFHNKVYEGYQELVKMYPERIVSIDATKSIDEVYEECLKVIEEKRNDRCE